MSANAVAYLYHIFMARLMLPADYGVLVTLTSVLYVLDVSMRTVQLGVIRAITTARDAPPERVRPVVMVAMRTLVPLACAVFLILSVAGTRAAGFLHLGTATPVILLATYATLSFLIPVPRGILLGLNRLYGASVSIVLEPLGRVAVGLALVVWGLKVNGALLGYVIGQSLAIAAGLLLLRPQLARRAPSQAPQAGLLRGLDRYALLVLVANGCLMTMASVDQITVRHFFSADVAGNFAVAFVLGRLIVVSALSLGVVVHTRSATTATDYAGRASLLAKGLLVMGAIAVAFTAAFLVAPAAIVQVMAGSRYDVAQAYVGLVGIEMTLFSLVYVQVYYHLSLKTTRVLWPLSLAAISEVVLLARYHATVQQVLLVLIVVMSGLLVSVSVLSWRHFRDNRRSAMVAVPGSVAADADAR
jgi:O-antigen/teichoic acid export membrane protein